MKFSRIDLSDSQSIIFGTLCMSHPHFLVFINLMDLIKKVRYFFEIKTKTFWLYLESKHLLPNLKNRIFSRTSLSIFVKYHFIKKLQLVKKINY